MKSFTEFMNAKTKTEASFVRQKGRPMTNMPKPDKDEEGYDKSVDDYMVKSLGNKHYGDGGDIPVPPEVLAKGRTASAARAMPAPKPAPFDRPRPAAAPAGGMDDTNYHAGLEKLRGELAHYKPGMVLRALFPKADPEMLNDFLSKFGE